ncbi:hypothetical protein MMC10_011375 [Thelotrema lepadinum]|nr:hypothetical protein [Thelotrema lepadinum]
MSMLDRMLDRWRQRTIELGDCHKLPDFYREQERKSIENGYPAAKSLLQDVHREKEELIKVAAALKANGQEVDASRFKRKVEEWCRAYENCMKLVEDIMQEIKTSQTPKTSSSATPGVGRLRHFGHPRPPKYDDTYLGGGWKHVPKRQ